MNAFEDFVNIELPRRSAFLTVEITGYDDDPNGGGAPAILTGAPKGTWYYRETPNGTSYRKNNLGVWEKASSELITQTDMTVEVNYSTGFDPPSDTVFAQQSDIDAYGPIKHFMALLDALPPLIKHTVTVNLSGEDHYPRSSETYAAWELRGKLFIGGSLVLNGGLPSTYISRDASLEDLVPTSTQTGSYDPYMTFSGTPFDGYDLHGWFAVFDTGQVTIIHDHDGYNLYFIDELSPTPSSVTVARPSTRLLNDDGLGARQAGTSFFLWHGSRTNSGYEVQINDLCIAPYGGNGLYCDETNVLVSHLLLDNTEGPSEGGNSLFLYGGNSVNNITCCSRLSTLGSTVPRFPVFMGGKATLLLYTAYFRGGHYGALVRYGKGEEFRCRGLIMDGVGTMAPRFQDRGSILVVGGQCRAYHLGNGKRNEIRNCTTYGLVLRDGGHVRGPYIPVLVFKNMSAPCVRLGNTGVLDLANYEDSSFLDGGGNTDVGIQIDGPGADVQMNSLSDVSGSVGDVRMADGTILSYSYIDSEGPVIDFFHNVIEII